MTPIEAASTIERIRPASGRATGTRSPAGALLVALGVLGLLGVLCTVVLLVGGAAGERSALVTVPGDGWPVWLSGPLRGLHLEISRASFQTYVLVMCGCYGLVLLGARRLPAPALASTIVLAHVALALGPPLLSQDVFGYLSYARLGAVHGLDPYVHYPSEAPTDVTFPYIGWPFQLSPYGPLFTLSSYAVAPLGLAGGVWAMKAIAALASLATIWLCARAAERMGRSATWAAAFVGLNPVLLVMAVGGAHNDMLMLAFLSLALLYTAGAAPRARAGAAALVAGVGVKVTAGISLAFLAFAEPRWRDRLRIVAAAALACVALALVAVVGFGVHALGFLSAVGSQQQLVATHSIPAETARLVGLSATGTTPGWWRHAFLAAFALAFAFALWRTHRGADWRTAAGWATLALLLSTAWLLPWYAVWLLPLAAVGGDRLLTAAALVFCAYALMIHLPLADPLLSPGPVHHHVKLSGIPIPHLSYRLKLAGLEILRHAHLDLRF